MTRVAWWFPVAAVALTISAGRWSTGWWRRRARARFGGPPEAGPRPGWLRVGRTLATRFACRFAGRWRRSVPIADDVAPTLEAVARAVAAGVGLGSAIAALDTSARPFAAVLAGATVDHRLGHDLGPALAAAGTAAERRIPEVALGLSVLEVAADHGGATAAALHRAASAVRERRTVVAERAVHSAQARLSALVLTLVPLAFGTWTAATDRRVAHFLLGTPAGAACLLSGLAVNGAGWWWMRRVVRGPRGA